MPVCVFASPLTAMVVSPSIKSTGVSEMGCASQRITFGGQGGYSDFADPLKENGDSLTAQQEKFNDHINLEHVFDDVVGANPYEGTKMGVELVSQLRQNQFRVMTDDQIDAFVDVLIRAFDIKNRI
jgi:hypothetical protein